MVRLDIDDIGASFGNRQVLSGISAQGLTGGCLTAVIGPNAAGKSTLFRRIAGLISGPGRVALSGANRGGVCYMPQDTGANAVLTVFESILLAGRQSSGGWRVSDLELARIDEILDLLDIADVAFRNLGELSGGQRQVVSLAQALICSPDILLMDEPTSALDLHRQVGVLDLIRERARVEDILVLVALHDLNHALRYCDNALVIADGRMSAFGPAVEVIDEALLANIYRVRGRIERCSAGRPMVIIDGPMTGEPLRPRLAS